VSTFESKIIIYRSLSDTYQFLADFNNHQQLMPDNVQNWTSTYNEASFGIQNMVQLSLQIAERVENKFIKIIAVGSPPFQIQLNWELTSDNESTTATFTINAELNMMMKMMASGPLQKLADHETTALATALSK
jgi:carbon monoxide dehydrogenase subunit G